jgi:hypothetical protein
VHPDACSLAASAALSARAAMVAEVPCNPGLADQEAGTKNWIFRGSKYPNLFTVVLNSLIYKDNVPKRSHKDKILSTKKIRTTL